MRILCLQNGETALIHGWRNFRHHETRFFDDGLDIEDEVC